MRTIITLFPVLLLIFLISCDAPPPATPATTLVEIAFDLEEDSYLLNGHWYAADSPLLGCAPAFAIYLDGEEAALHLKYCVTTGSILPETIILANDYCQLVPNLPLFPTADHNIMKWKIPLEHDFVTCLYEEYAWIDLRFDFIYE